jgi:hypothetical protein
MIKKIVLLLIITWQVILYLPAAVSAQEVPAPSNDPFKISVPTPNLEGTSYGPADDVRILLIWTLPGIDPANPPTIEDYGFRVSRADLSKPMIEFEPEPEGYTPGTPGGWIEDDSVAANQTYTYEVVIFDRGIEDQNGNIQKNESAPVRISVQAIPDESSEDDSDCGGQAQLTTSIKEKTVTLTWKKMCDATEYEITRTGTAAGAEPVLLASGLDGETLTYTDPNLPPGDYLYEVTGYRLISDTPNLDLPEVISSFFIGRAKAQSATKEAVGSAQAAVTVPGAEPEPDTQTQQPDTNNGTPGGTAGGTASGSATTDKCKGLIDPACTLQENLQHIYPISVKIIIFLAFLAVIMAGYTYITSFGQPERISEAKNWLIAAISGVALILLIPLIMNALKQLPLPGVS